MKKQTILCTLILLFVLIISCQKRSKAPKRENQKIVFLSNRESPKREFDIFVMNLDGSGQKNLSKQISGVRSISNPRLSPDGKEIIFIAFVAEKKLLQKMEIDGKNLVTLTEVGIDDPNPAFSPSGSKILFVDIVNKRRQIFILDSEKKNRKNLSNNEYDEREAEFSRDGSKIVFARKRTKNYSICIMNTDGGRKIVLINNDAENRDPHFAADNSKIVFSSYNGKNSDIFIVNSSGGKAKKLFDSQAQETKPKFSPDGSNIIFLSNLRGMKYRDVLLYDMKKKRTKNLTRQLNVINRNPHFVSDGNKIVFESIKFGNAEIYCVELNGINLVNLSNHPKWDCAPHY